MKEIFFCPFPTLAALPISVVVDQSANNSPPVLYFRPFCPLVLTLLRAPPCPSVADATGFTEWGPAPPLFPLVVVLVTFSFFCPSLFFGSKGSINVARAFVHQNPFCQPKNPLVTERKISPPLPLSLSASPAMGIPPTHLITSDCLPPRTQHGRFFFFINISLHPYPRLILASPQVMR